MKYVDSQARLHYYVRHEPTINVPAIVFACCLAGYVVHGLLIVDLSSLIHVLGN